MTFDPTAPVVLNETIWLIPKTRWIGGYDAARYLENKTMQLFQICKDYQLILKFKIFTQLLRKLEQADVKVKSVEIFFVSPTYNAGLVISLETDRGSLSQLKKESIQILSVEEFSTSDAGYAKYSQQSL